MRCPQCHTENRAGRKFCAACGQALALACSACGFVNDPGDRFCGECGQALTAIPPPEPTRPPNITRPEERSATPATSSPVAPHPPDAERRQLTVMFCDLVGSTPLAEQLDPEDLREVVRAYQQTCAEVIQRVDGHIAQYLGDGLLVYFGYPQAHDDDAQRAVQAGRSILEAMETLNSRLERDKGLRLAVRVGIHTGLVVVGAMGGGGRQEQLALGDAPNVAARIQGLAAPDTVLISAATHRLVQGYFTVAALGPQTLKGVAAPVPVYRILGVSEAQSRLDVAAATGLTPLVGRQSEVALLLERWEQSKARLGQVVLLSGEGGIGKSRLIEVLRQQVVGEGSPCIMLRCSPYHTSSALYPVIEHLKRWLAWRRDETPTAKLDKLDGMLQAYCIALDEIAPLFATLLSVPLPEGRYPPLLLSPQQQRQRTMDALVAWLLAEAERQPVLAVWEDLHWADPSTLELLSLVIEQVPMVRLLTLVTCRPEFRPPWAPRSHLTQLTLSRLPRPQVETMVQQLTGDKPLPAEVLAQVVARTDGVPLLTTKGWTAPEVERAYARAYALCQQVGDTRELFPVLYGLFAFYNVRGNHQTARELAEQLLTLAQRYHDPALLLQGHRAVGEDLYLRGELIAARAHLEQGMALYDPQQHRAHVFLYGQDPGIGCRAYAAFVLWWLGYPEQALQRIHETLTLARELSHPFNLAIALNFAANVSRLRREWPASQAHAEALLTLATEQGFAFWVATGTIYHQALAIARRQQARSLELRAAMSLGRLWQQQGQRAEAYELLAPIYGWFTEGFDTADLQEAKALLEELAR